MLSRVYDSPKPRTFLCSFVQGCHHDETTAGLELLFVVRKYFEAFLQSRSSRPVFLQEAYRASGRAAGLAVKFLGRITGFGQPRALLSKPS